MNQEILEIRNQLVIDLDYYCLLLEELDRESKQLNAYDLKKFNDRMETLDRFGNTVIYYDDIMTDYIDKMPQPHEINKLRDRLKIAQRYIQRLGGDWNNVLWGKLSDF
jgi:hypothetical protein